ncbi:MAG: carbon storage regulator [Gammaproteobacteria bacterium]|jgi:carbon storage regulator|nr:carbon storage regulator [Gammaproteobacteria bacterium]
MLILSRRPNESLRIGDNVVITVVGFSGNQIRLGITAPPNVVVDREEVHQRKMAEHDTQISPVPSPAVPPTRTPTVRGRPEVRRRSRLQAE